MHAFRCFLLLVCLLMPAGANAAAERGEETLETLPILFDDTLKDADEAPGWLPTPAETAPLPTA